LYSGEQYDPNAGFYYLRARYYNQDNGRFVTTDPWNGNAFEPVTLHKYLYANANPVMFSDPSGKFSLARVAIATAITSIIITSVIRATNSMVHGLSAFISKPIIWHGGVLIKTGDIATIAGGVLTAYFESECVNIGGGKKAKAKGIYLVILFGFSAGPLPINTSASSFALKTPGLFGPDPYALKGLSSFTSVSWSAGIGGSATEIIMGYGYGLSAGLMFGLDIGIDILMGYSIPIAPVCKKDIPCR